MDKKSRETTILCVEIMNSKRQVKGKLDHVVQFDVNVMLNLSTVEPLSFHVNGFALSLALKQRLGATRNWPILSGIVWGDTGQQ